MKLEYILHENVSKENLVDIVKIKSVAWPYSYEKQIDWINNNIKTNDLHFLLYEDTEPVAYLNLINIELIIDYKKFNAVGVGNVCSLEKGKGWGNELIKKTNNFIKEHNYIGLLFCKYNLVNYYYRNNWTLITKDKLELLFDNKEIETMIFNFHQKFDRIKYLNSPF